MQNALVAQKKFVTPSAETANAGKGFKEQNVKHASRIANLILTVTTALWNMQERIVTLVLRDIAWGWTNRVRTQIAPWSVYVSDPLLN